MRAKNLITPLQNRINFSLTETFCSKANPYIAIYHYVILAPDEKKKKI